MNQKFVSTLILGLSALLLAGCDYRATTVVPPASSAISGSIGEMYLRAGLASEVSRPEILGKHYQPGRDSWKVIACAKFTLADGGEGRDCNDSFELYQLDTGKWMVSGTLNGRYLWLEMAGK